MFWPYPLCIPSMAEVVSWTELIIVLLCFLGVFLVQCIFGSVFSDLNFIFFAFCNCTSLTSDKKFWLSFVRRERHMLWRYLCICLHTGPIMFITVEYLSCGCVLILD